MKKFFLTLFLVVLLTIPAIAGAAEFNITFGWNANTETDLAGYKVFASTSVDGAKSEILDIGAPATQGISNPLPEGHYWFWLMAYDEAGNPSTYAGPIEQVLEAPDEPPAQPTGFVIIKIMIIDVQNSNP